MYLWQTAFIYGGTFMIYDIMMYRIEGAMIAANLIASFLMIAMLGASIKHLKTRRTKHIMFFLTCIGIFFASTFDLIAWIFDGNVNMAKAMLLVNGATLIFGYWFSATYSGYLISLVQETRHVPDYVKPCVILGFYAASLWTICGMATGHIIKIENGWYKVTSWYEYTVVFFLILGIFGLITIICNFKRLGVANLLAALLYYLAYPAASIISKYFLPESTFNYCFTALAAVVVYLVIQAENEKEYVERESALIKEAHVDPMTGVMNRRAFEEAIEQFESSEMVGVIYCDLNGLKYRNDNIGHEAGDELIITFTNITRNYFRGQDIYRLAGDEFVILMNDVPRDVFIIRANALKTRLQQEEYPIASVGFKHDAGQYIVRSIKKAEERMYKEKEDFYKKYPEFKRV